MVDQRSTTAGRKDFGSVVRPPPPRLEVPTYPGTQHGSSDPLLEILLGVQQQMTLLQQQLAAQQQQMTLLQQQQQLARPLNYFLALKEVNAPNFAGCKDPLEAEKWITEMEKFCRALCIPKDEWVNVTIPFLIAEAWFISVSHAYESGGVRIDWAQFQDNFFSNFFPATFRIDKQNDFFNLKQGSMTVIQYASMFNQLSRFAPAFMVQEHSMVTRFEEGLNLNLREYMGTPLATTFQEVLVLALWAERLITESNQIRHSSSPRPWNEQYKETEPAANKKAIQRDLDRSTAHGQEDKKKMDFRQRRIIQLEMDLDQKHAPQLYAEQLSVQKLLIEKEAKLKDQANEQIEALRQRIIQLEKDLDQKHALQLNAERSCRQLTKKAEALQKNLTEKEAAELKERISVNRDLIEKEPNSNDELQDALKEAISEEQHRNLFKEAMKTKYKVETELVEKAIELCFMWVVSLTDPIWYPRILVSENVEIEEVFDESDVELNDMKAKHGDAVYNIVTTALCEINGYNPSGRLITRDWIFNERRTTLVKGVGILLRALFRLKGIYAVSDAEDDEDDE